MRVDNYSFVGSNTNTGAARELLVQRLQSGHVLRHADADARRPQRARRLGNWSTNSQTPCSSFGKQYVNANLQNVPARLRLQHRAAAHRRDLYGQPRYRAARQLRQDTTSSRVRPTSSTTALEQNLPDTLTQFYPLGFTTPGHAVAPSISYNSDFSIEHHFKGTDMSFKLTPFLRQTQDQVENFYINYTDRPHLRAQRRQPNVVGLRVSVRQGRLQPQRHFGPALLRVHVRDGEVQHCCRTARRFSRRSTPASRSTTPTRKPARRAVRQYGKKQFGAIALRLHDQTGLVRGAVLHAAAAAPDPSCKADDVANPYWLSPAFSLYDPTAAYLPYSIFPGPRRLGRERVQLPVRRDAAAQLQARQAHRHAVAAVSWRATATARR